MVFGFGKLQIIADMDGGWRTIGPFATNTSLFLIDDHLSSQLYSIASRNSSVRSRLVVGLYLWVPRGCFSFFACIGGVLGFVLILLDIRCSAHHIFSLGVSIGGSQSFRRIV
jgi:hypothetical protein